MEYMVLADNGQEYGPADLDTLHRWVADGRIRSSTQLREIASGQTVGASSIPELFSASQYSVPPILPQQTSAGNTGTLIKITIYSGLAILVFFLFRGIGLIFAGFAFYDAIRVKLSGDKYGTIAILIAGTTLLIVGIGWLMRMNSGAT